MAAPGDDGAGKDGAGKGGYEGDVAPAAPAAAAPAAAAEIDEPEIEEEREAREEEALMAAAGPAPSPSDRRPRVELPPAPEDEGPTYYRIGIDHTYEPGSEEIHFQCTRIKKLENLEVAGADLKRLILVANCIEKIENLESLVNLEHLELYQNLVKRIENISHLSSLTVLDLSFNKIRNMDPLGSCTFDKLDKLYLSSNKIDDMKAIFHFTTLTMLELGSNRIRCVPPELAQLSNLQELWLGKNKITTMALPPLPALTKLSMQSNRLEVWDATLFRNCPAMAYMYLGHNNLPDLPEEFGMLEKLKEVDLAANAIKTIKPLPQLVNLEEIWMNDCQISELDEVSNLTAFGALKAIYLERNPMHGLGNPEMEQRYKEKILEALPNLMQLDAERLNCTIKVITDGSEANVIGIRKR